MPSRCDIQCRKQKKSYAAFLKFFPPLFPKCVVPYFDSRQRQLHTIKPPHCPKTAHTVCENIPKFFLNLVCWICSRRKLILIASFFADEYLRQHWVNSFFFPKVRSNYYISLWWQLVCFWQKKQKRKRRVLEQTPPTPMSHQTRPGPRSKKILYLHIGRVEGRAHIT